MDVVVARFGEIGSKSPQVRGKMVKVLRQRVEDRLEYEEIDYNSVSKINARITVDTGEPEKTAELASEIPGVASCSPAYETEPSIDSIKQAVSKLEVGKSFGVETNRAGEHGFDSRDVNEEIGGFILERNDTKVNLDDPDTWIYVDVRDDRAFVYSEILQGPDGFPVGSQGELAALISGGIDSPVAAYELMSRGADILPIYFYNKPVAAEDHLLRFKSVLDKLERFNPSKKWHYYIVDMEDVNEELMRIDSGRMIVHRIIMFRVAEKIAEKDGVQGIVTGESLGQKSSQTPKNLEMTSTQVRKPVHRPLLNLSKSEITGKAEQIDTLEESNIESACTSLSPENPATELKEDELERVEQRISVDDLVERAWSNTEKNLL